MKQDSTKISSNRQKKMGIVTELSEKFGKAKAIVFTNYQGLTHKQLEGFKKAIKPLQAEYVVAKNSLLTLALAENKLKLEKDMVLEGQTGTLFLYDDVIAPLKALAKVIKELNLPSVKFGIMENAPVTGEQVLKLSTLPTREVLLSQLVGNLKGPIYGLHRALSWNLQKLIMTLNAIAKVKPQNSNVKTEIQMPETLSTLSEVKSLPDGGTAAEPNITEPETIAQETVAEVVAEQPEKDNPTIEVEQAEQAERSEVPSKAEGQTGEPTPAEKNETKLSDEGKQEGGEN